MEVGYVGLGKMGANMVERLLEKGYRVVVYDRNREALRAMEQKGATIADSLSELAFAMTAPSVIWVMVPHTAVDDVLKELASRLAPGDTVIDGGNSPYRESMRRAKELAAAGIEFLDAGVSGGPAGARNGACIMAGGKPEVYARFERLFKDLAVEGGYARVGQAGAGHFVKMVHNGIEYGMMQALAEGFAVLRASPFGLDLAKVADLYGHRSVIESRLVDWLRNAYALSGQELEEVSGVVAQSGEGAWTAETAKELGVPVPVIEAALRFRLASAKDPGYTGKVLSALRNQFGGHDMKKQERAKEKVKA
ncbi:MAG: decarboxylating 6-phosphogluconate dehydrogenase [Nitrospiraceae bacterium]|nr:decarboxylating 6-phosphogluconate dehydrogenase [Nitrospiraceae bacterium]